MQLGTAANSRTLQAQEAMAQASKDPDSSKNNVMLKQEASGMGFYGYIPMGRRHLLYHGLCQIATTPGE